MDAEGDVDAEVPEGDVGVREPADDPLLPAAPVPLAALEPPAAAVPLATADDAPDTAAVVLLPLTPVVWEAKADVAAVSTAVVAVPDSKGLESVAVGSAALPETALVSTGDEDVVAPTEVTGFAEVVAS